MKNYCKDCKKPLGDYKSIRCPDCNKKFKHENRKRFFCIDCKKELNNKSIRCLDCHNKLKYKNRKRYFCKDCGKEISSPDAERCRSCAMKGNRIALTDGRSTIKHYCLDCGKEIYYTSIRCKKCAKQGELHSQFGKKWTEETKMKMSGSNSLLYIDGRYLKKQFCSDCGKKVSYNIDGKGRCQQCYSKWRSINLIGENHHNWQGGISKLPYAFEFTEELKEQIRKRDNYECQNCGITEEEHLIVLGRILSIHHIDYNKQNCTEDNLITVCISCNVRANSNRNYWQDFYNNLLNKITISK